MVVHSPVADSFAVGHILVGDSLVEGIPAEDNLDTLHLAAGSLAVVRNPAGDNSARDSLAAVDSPAVAAHTPAALRPVADTPAVVDRAAAVAVHIPVAFVRTAPALLPVARNTCKSVLHPTTAGNNVYNA